MLRCRRCAVPFCIAAFLDHEFHVGIQNSVAFQGDQSRPQTSVMGIHHQRITVFLGGMEIFACFQTFQNAAGVVGSSHRRDQHILHCRLFQDQQIFLDDQLVCASVEDLHEERRKPFRCGIGRRYGQNTLHAVFLFPEKRTQQTAEGKNEEQF